MCYFGEEGCHCPPAVVCRLRSSPLDGEPGADTGLVLVLLDQPRKTKVRDLHDVVVANKHVTSCQVPEKKKQMRARVSNDRPNYYSDQSHRWM